MNKKVLVVDDQPEVRELVSVSLQLGDYDVKQATNGDDALTIAKEFLPDLMLLDINMPNGTLDGFEVCKLIKSDPITKNIKVVMLSSRLQKILKWLCSVLKINLKILKKGSWQVV